MHVVLKTSFVFKSSAEIGRFKKRHKARHNAAGNIHAAKSTQIQRQITAETRPIITQNSARTRRKLMQLFAKARVVTSYGSNSYGKENDYPT